MLKDIDNIKIPVKIGEKQLYLRYNLNSRLYLEYMTDYDKLTNTPPDLWSVEDTLHYLRALLIDNYYEDNKDSINMRDFDSVKPTISELGQLLSDFDIDELILSITEAIVTSLPDLPVVEDENF